MRSYSEVSSREYLVVSDESVLFGTWFRNPPKLNRNYSEKSLQKLCSFVLISATNTFDAAWRRMRFAKETNAFCPGDEHFSAGDQCIRNARLNFSHTQTAQGWHANSWSVPNFFRSSCSQSQSAVFLLKSIVDEKWKIFLYCHSPISKKLSENLLWKIHSQIEMMPICNKLKSRGHFIVL